MLYRSVLGLIHNTPLLKLPRTSAALGRNIYLKLEGANPSGGIEDRISRTLLESAETRGDLKPGMLIVESSSTSMAISLAMIARQRGYQLLCITGTDTTPAEFGLLAAFGAEVVKMSESDPNEIPAARRNRAMNLLADARNGWWFDRYATPELIAQLSHRVGAEIVRDIESIPHWIVAPHPTLQLLSGLSEYFKSHWPDTRVMSVEHGAVSRSIDSARIRISAGETAPIEFPAVDARVAATGEKVLETIRSIARQESVLLGPLSGLAMAGLIGEIDRTVPGDDIVVIAPDLGWKHLSAIFGETARFNSAGQAAEFEPLEKLAVAWS